MTIKEQSKAGKKAQRKQVKSQNIVFKDTGIRCLECPTQYLLVCNAGLVTGVQQEDLLQVFLPFGSVQHVVMIPGKPYSFIAYSDAKAAERAVEGVHGLLCLSQGQGPLYLSYAERVPEVCSPWDSRGLPEGLLLVEDFVTEEQEQKLLWCVDWSKQDSPAGSLKHRRVKHYGYEFRYDTNNVDKDSPLEEKIPAECDDAISAVLQRGYILQRPDQLTVNQYKPGQGIPPHVDTHSAFDDVILSLSLGSSVVMEFKNPHGCHVPVLLPRRSLLVMGGEARYLWTHGITPRQLDVVPSTCGGLTLQQRGTRTSFTFRRVRRGNCCCSFPQQCDSRKEVVEEGDPVGSETAAWELEKLHVHKVYEEIASHFSHTRHKPWPNVLQFTTSLPAGAILVDAGCGNGKYLGHNKDVYEVGCDYSSSLIQICKDRGFQVFTGDCLNVPLRSGIADACISIAVIHHLSTRLRRLQALQELSRLLCPGGQSLVYVWAKEQQKGPNVSSYLKTGRLKNATKSCNGMCGCQTGVVLQSKSRNTKDCNVDGGNVKDKLSSVCDVVNSNTESFTCDTVKEAITTNSIKEKLDVHSCQGSDNPVEASRENPVPEESKEEGVDKADNETHTKLSLPHTCQSCTVSLPIHTNRTDFKHQDLLVPWKLKPEAGRKLAAAAEVSKATGSEPVFHRYYHMFTEGELEKLCEEIAGVEVVRSYYDQGNWCVIFQRVQ